MRKAKLEIEVDSPKSTFSINGNIILLPGTYKDRYVCFHDSEPNKVYIGIDTSSLGRNECELQKYNEQMRERIEGLFKKLGCKSRVDYSCPMDMSLMLLQNGVHMFIKKPVKVTIKT